MANTIPQLMHRNFCGTYFSKEKLNIIFPAEGYTQRKELYYVNVTVNFSRQKK